MQKSNRWAYSNLSVPQNIAKELLSVEYMVKGETISSSWPVKGNFERDALSRWKPSHKICWEHLWFGCCFLSIRTANRNIYHCFQKCGVLKFLTMRPQATLAGTYTAQVASNGGSTCITSIMILLPVGKTVWGLQLRLRFSLVLLSVPLSNLEVPSSILWFKMTLLIGNTARK